MAQSTLRDSAGLSLESHWGRAIPCKLETKGFWWSFTPASINQCFVVTVLMEALRQTKTVLNVANPLRGREKESHNSQNEG